MTNELARLGEHIRRLRKAQGLSQDDLGERASVNPKYLGEIERGTGNPSFEVLVRLAAALQVELGTLVGDDLVRMSASEVRDEVHRRLAQLPDSTLRDLARLLRFLPLR